MTRQRFHTIVIGAGSGGLTVAVGLAGLGKRVALVERGRIGGDCANVGCIPSKTLIHLAAEFSRSAPTAPSSGSDVLAAVRARRDRLWQEEEAWIEDVTNLAVVRGAARLAGPRTVLVTSDNGSDNGSGDGPEGSLDGSLQGGSPLELAADHIVLATGSRPVEIEIDGLPAHRQHTNESIFELDAPPGHLAIVGAGAIGSELAFAFRKLGAAVTLVEMGDRPLSPFEPEVSDVLRDRFGEAGIELRLNAKASSWSESSRTLHVDHETGTRAVEDVDAVLLAVGRRANLDGIGLETVGLEPHPGGLQTNAFGRTDTSTVYAIGDANRRSAFTHSANAQGRRLVQKLVFPWLPVGREGSWPAVAFTDPEVAHVGPTRAKLAARLPDSMIRTIRIDLADTDRGYTTYLKQGFLMVHAMRLTGRVLSATIVGPHASEMLPLLTHAVNGGPGLYRLANHVFAYPTAMESARKAADTFVFDTLKRLPGELWHYLQHRYRRPKSHRPRAEESE